MNRKKGIRIIFMGTPEFAVPSLEILVTNGYNIVAVITSTDKYGGRGGKQLLQSAIKKYALAHDIPVLQPKNLKSPAFIDELSSLKADLQVVVAFRMLPEVVWNMPPLGTINLHGSLLPKYRGAAPINWAIINGENETGVTSFKLKHEIDTGDIIIQEKITIEPSDNAGSLHDKMKILGAEVVLKTVQLIENEEVIFTKQDDSKLSKAPKIYHEDCKLDFTNKGLAIINKIRGLSPYPGAWIEHDGVEYKIYKASYNKCKHNIKPGSMITDNKTYWKMVCNDGLILLEVVKKPGKQKMAIRDFLNGNTIL
jgi:methionyl-tRNA formyltransferase